MPYFLRVPSTFRLVLKSHVTFQREKRARYYEAYSMPISYGSPFCNLAPGILDWIRAQPPRLVTKQQFVK